MIELDATYTHRLRGLKFIDLFAGIGGFRYGMEYFGANCVFSSEWDTFAQECYQANFDEQPRGDITQISASDIPQHDILCAGFPCQAFSVSGQRRGFADTRGTLFFDVARIAQYHQPQILLLENVKNFAKHDAGKTLQTVVQTLSEIGYQPYYQVLNSGLFGVPQKRERIYFVALRQNLQADHFSFPTGFEQKSNVESILDQDVDDDLYLVRDDIEIYKNPHIDPDIFGHYPQKPLQIGKVNKGGQGERIYSSFGHAITQAATTGGPGGTTGLYLINGRVRKLTPKESSRVQGFPERFQPHSRKNQAWKQIGNSVPVNVIQGIIKHLLDGEYLQ